MKTNKTLLFLLSICSQIIFGRTFSSKEIKGQVFADLIALQSVTIVNNTKQHFAVTDYSGLFSIVIQENDVLVFWE